MYQRKKFKIGRDSETEKNWQTEMWGRSLAGWSKPEGEETKIKPKTARTCWLSARWQQSLYIALTGTNSDHLTIFVIRYQAEQCWKPLPEGLPKVQAETATEECPRCGLSATLCICYWQDSVWMEYQSFMSLDYNLLSFLCARASHGTWQYVTLPF